MRLLISAEGDNEPKGHHYMMVDGVGFLIDLSAVTGTLHDPTIARVEWSPRPAAGDTREGGVIIYRTGDRQPFFDQAALKAYLAAYEVRKAELMAAGAQPKPDAV